MDSVVGATIIGRSAIVRGDLLGEGDVQIEGTFEGNIKVGGARVTLGPDANVQANLQARDVVVQGKFQGDVHASGRVELRSTAVVSGNIYANRFSVEQEAVLRGHVDSFDAAPARGADGGGTNAPKPQPLSFREEKAGESPVETLDGAVPQRLPLSMPSGLAAAAASVANGQRAATTPDDTTLPQPGWAAEPRNS